MIVYKNQFSTTMRKYIGLEGYASSDDGKTWTKNKTPEELIKKLPYYKVVVCGTT